MFERRLKFLLMLPILASVVLIGRLYGLQILRGAAYQEQADEALLVPAQYLPPLRGRILDRTGKALVSDEPAHDLSVHYGALSLSESYLQRLADRIRRQESAWRAASRAALEQEVRRRIAEMWTTLQRVSGRSMRDLRERRDAICASVENLRRYIWQARRRRGYEEPLEKLRLREQDLFHPLLRNISPEARTRIELQLANLPFVRIEPAVRRVWCDDAEPVCHVLGRLGSVTSRRIGEDPFKNDPLKAYRAGDRAGVSGAEYCAEHLLRGRRGYEKRDLDGRLKDLKPTVDGVDVRLTIDLALQREIARILRDAVAEHAHRTGACCVVLDVRSREILALVSFPTYRREQYDADYASLRDSARHRPLLFRAVMEEYQPGSIVKPVVLLAGFKHGVVRPEQTSYCTGSLIEGAPKWHCWTHWKGLPGHGELTPEEAIQHSCNVFFYGLGQRLAAHRLTRFYQAFICGPDLDGPRRRGTGLIEERSGIIPTREWMRSHRKRDFRPADGRNFSIGQGEMQITPLQAANMFATLATGRYRDPTLLLEDPAPRPEAVIEGIPEEAWQIVRRGLFRCVNEPGGTAYRYARMDTLEVCGKTGSAQCVSRVVEQRFTFEADNGKHRTAVAPTIEAARDLLGLPPTIRCIKREGLKRWPPPEPGKTDPPTHAWFAAFAPYQAPRVALAVVIEHGGGGGQAAGPVGRAILATLMDGGHGDLRPAGPAAEPSPNVVLMSPQP